MTETVTTLQIVPAIEFVVRGTPQPKGSARAFKHNGSGRVIVWADNRGRLKVWESCVRAAALRVRPRDRFYGPVGLTVRFELARPKSATPAKRPHPHVKPDLSKLLRGIEDALSGILYNDDAQIVQVRCEKTYCPADQEPGAVVTVIALGGR